MPMVASRRPRVCNAGQMKCPHRARGVKDTKASDSLGATEAEHPLLRVSLENV